MNLKLTDKQINSVIREYLLDLSEPEQMRLGLLVFARNDRIDWAPALGAVIRQIAKEHSMTITQVLKRAGS